MLPDLYSGKTSDPLRGTADIPKTGLAQCPKCSAAAGWGAGALAAAATLAANLTAIRDLHGAARLAVPGALFLDELDDFHALHDLAENDVLAIQMRGGHGAEEELRPVGVRPAIRHGEDAGGRVLVLESLIPELVAVDGLAARAVALGEVTALAHEAGDHAVELAALVVQGLARSALALLPRAQRAEVLGGLRHVLREQLHLDAAGGTAADLHIEEDHRVRHLRATSGRLGRASVHGASASRETRAPGRGPA
mmetsp:Transcript_2280/g.5694  ORF Transcript_2280/g.5694 Transcript_2280/m.5694 type:complete len:252 (+) Transcript_2280:25-780(+)